MSIETIPAFSMWKVFNETIVPTLLNMDYAEIGLQKLVNIVKTKEFFSIFVYDQDPALSYEQYQAMSEKYKAFTVWLLGRFYYLLNCKELHKMHEFIIDAQWRIMDKVSVTQPNVYLELCSEYISALKQLNDYHKSLKEVTSEKAVLHVFKPQEHVELKNKLDLSAIPVEVASRQSCSHMQKQTAKFLHNILSKNIRMYYFDHVVYEIMDCFSYILAECSFDLKLIIFEIYVDLLKNNQFESDSITPNKFRETFNSLTSLIVQFIYTVYNTKVEMAKNDLEAFENLLVTFMEYSVNVPHHNLQIAKLAGFVCCKNVSATLKNMALDKACLFETQAPAMLLQNKSLEDAFKIFFDDDSTYLLNVVFKQVIFETEIYIRRNKAQTNICINEVSNTWIQLISEIKNTLQKNTCTPIICRLFKNLALIKFLTEEAVYVKMLFMDKLAQNGSSDSHITFFTESDILPYLIDSMNNHFTSCQAKSHSEIEEIVQKVFATLPMLYVAADVDYFFYCIAHPFIENLDSSQVVLCGDMDFMRKAKTLFRYLTQQNFAKYIAAEHACNFVNNIASGSIFVNTRNNKLIKIKDIYFGLLKKGLTSGIPNLTNDVFRKLLYVPNIYTNRDQWITEIFLPLINNPLSDEQVIILIEQISDFICKSSSQYIEVSLCEKMKRNVTTRMYCTSCTAELLSVNNHKDIVEKLQEIYSNEFVLVNNVCPALEGGAKTTDILLQQVLARFQENSDSGIQRALIRALKSYSHVQSFYTINVSKMWLNYIKHDNIEVQMALSRVIKRIFQRMQQNTQVSKEYKENVLKMCFEMLKDLTKSSLQTSNFVVQDVVLEYLDQLSSLEIENITLNCADLLLYFIMVPSSKYPLIAANILMKMATQRNTTTNVIFLQHKKELCFRIVQLCALNQALVGYTLAMSLEKVSLIFGNFGPKAFVTQEVRSLLPYFISLVTKIPVVEKLMLEIAQFLEVDLSNMLTSRYGYIFLHSLLNKTDEVFKKSCAYVEKHTGVNGSVLRKRHFQVILNNLLLNLHEKRDRVLLALQILAKEDSDGQNLPLRKIPDYLQPKLLGVLAFFGFKLVTQYSDKKMVLSSLAQLIRFMGPKHITPLRFKILAMLRTALNLNCEVFPELNSDIWDAFVRNCEIDALGPHIASIFVSLLPLLKHIPQKIEDIFKYLIIKNELFVKEYIPDLFFVVEMDINMEISTIIREHLRYFESMSFKDQLKSFMKYLSHETIDIRVYSLNYIKKLLEKNREEIDCMVLGYNGIDPTLVELLDILMLGCREKEESLKLACGECIGELGAIEPSHLPRRVNAEEKSFTFFITEDSFITSALNELTRALQAENNTPNMDRFSLAIQEMLKANDISPDVKSKGHHLWNSFPEAQRALMLPLLSSKYTLAYSVENIAVSPIYGSKYSSTFQAWIYNWTCNLILQLKPQKKTFLQVMLPSLKQDHKTLMHFLPHIVLHALLECNEDFHEKIYQEFMAVLNSLNNKQFNPAILTIQSHVNISSNQTTTTEEAKETQSIKVIFVLIDFLNRWLREWMWKQRNSTTDSEYTIIKVFLSRFSKIQLARCNYQCGEYARALMHLEEHIKDNPGDLQNQFGFLAKLYAHLDEPDGVTGVTALQDVEPPLEQRILALEVSGKLADAAACYERISPPLKPCHLQGLLQCYLDLDNVNTALNFTKGAIGSYPEYKGILLEIQAEPLWRLGQYEDLEKLLSKPELTNNNAWGLQIGRALLHLKNGERNTFKSTVNALQNELVESLGAASLQEGVYQHGYNNITRLHAISELQQVEKIIYELLARPNDHTVCESILKQLSSEWDLRLKVVQESIRTQEFILCLRRVSVELAKQVLGAKVPHSVPLLNSLLGKLWLCSATTARKLGVHQQGYTYTLKAEEYAPPRLFIEKAKLFWLREEYEQAITTLHRGLELMPGVIAKESMVENSAQLERRKLSAEAKLLVATYNDTISNVDVDKNVHNYTAAYEEYSEWEKSLVCLAQYYDRIFQTYSEAEKDNNKGSEHQVCMITFFGKSLLYGSNYVYQSLPRLLGIWFDYGTRFLEVTDPQVKDKKKDWLTRMSKLIDTFSKKLPAYIFLTAFSQLVSRICHPQKEVYMVISSIIIKLILKYPQHSLWMLLAMIKSSYPVRSSRCATILQDNNLKENENIMKLIGDFTKLAEKLIDLCNKKIDDDAQTARISTLLRSLPRMLSKDDFSEIMIPTQKFRRLILPNSDFNNSQHNPFPNHYVHIVGIEDEVTILQSLQHPRKITFRGSDGKRYIQMLKPKDDLRKDFRLMEFNDIVNQLLSRDPDSRQRRLYIRLYSVVPLNEECGLIEWVPNLVGLRPLLVTLYNQRGLGMKLREIKALSSNPKKREMFTKVLLERHPPILGEWFRKTFPDAQTWFIARTAYTRTTAVISMVGYILGLGDRHGENILLDSTCGDTVHVDFNCLFNKGETFEYPERVPFRLTHNMVAAMGPLGVEGIFRKSCVCTLRVLRTHTNTLMSIVTPFVYDPLVTWSKYTPGNSNAPIAERTDTKAVDHVRKIQLRLQGTGRSGRADSIPLSVEGQTNNLIQDAMSIDNLCQMYFGWGAQY